MNKLTILISRGESLIVNFILAIIFAEAITELGVKSELFHPLREWFFNKKSNPFFNFIHNVFDCGYCFSVYAGALSISLLFLCENKITYYFVLCVVVHRLSNLFHFMVDRVRG